MAKKNPGGAYDLKRRGLVPVTVPLTPEVRALAVSAARQASSRDAQARPSLAFWAARVLEEAARAELEKGKEPP